MLKMAMRRLLGLFMQPLCRLAEKRWLEKSFRILTYHRICSHRPGDRLCVLPEAFACHMAALAQRRASVISLAEAVACFSSGRWPLHAVVITFDDGYADNRRYAYEILQKWHFPATIFVTVAAVGRDSPMPGCGDGDERDRPLRWEEIKEMVDSGLVEIGSHTMSHPLLTSLSDSDLAEELRTSRLVLQERLQRPINFLAYPSGAWDQRVAEAAAAAGYTAAVTVMPGRNTAHQPLLALRRTEISGDDDAALFAAKLDGAFDLWHALRQAAQRAF